MEHIDVIVLEADGEVSNGKGYGEAIVRRLEELNYSPTLIRIKENSDKLNDLPSKPIIISGSMTEVTSDIKWIKNAQNFVKKRILQNQNSDINHRKPMLGICFGAQLIAES